MSSRAPQELAAQLSSGLLSFPVTPFNADLTIDEGAYHEHLDWLSSFPVAGLFTPGGTGEYFAMTPEEVDKVVRVAVADLGAKMPVVAPAGGPTMSAVAQARRAEEAGADGILLFPPYLSVGPQRGILEHIVAVCRATRLGVVVYGRANAIPTADTLARAADACPNLVGYKDGVGDLEAMVRIRSRLGERLICIGGLPTAEVFAQPYLAMGVVTYSSAVFNFVPELALDFYRAVRGGDHDRTQALLDDFYIPFTEIRDRDPGYAVSIIKAGLDAIGRKGGPVRPPLAALRPDELEELSALLARNPAAGLLSA